MSVQYICIYLLTYVPTHTLIEEVLSSDDIRQPALTTGSISPETNSDCHRQVDVLSPTSPLVVSDTEQEGPEISHISGDDSDQRPAPQASAATGTA